MRKNNLHHIILISVLAVNLFVGCATKSVAPNTLTEEEKKEGWVLLFDGKTLDNWHVYNKGQQASEWSVVNGEIYCDPDSPNRIGDLTSDKEYENFEFQFDWKLPEKGNSGVFINVVEIDTLIAGWLSGPEYQLLEDTHKDYAIPTKRAGALYGFLAPMNEVKAAADQWNHSKIIQQNGKAQFYMNDVLTAEMDFTTDHWREEVSKSGFSKYPHFGKYIKGKIVLQNWASGVVFRNIKVREI